MAAFRQVQSYIKTAMNTKKRVLLWHSLFYFIGNCLVMDLGMKIAVSDLENIESFFIKIVLIDIIEFM